MFYGPFLVQNLEKANNTIPRKRLDRQTLFCRTLPTLPIKFDDLSIRIETIDRKAEAAESLAK